MSKYPEYVEIEGKRYKINTDFKVAIECNRIAEDKNIGDYERALAIIYKLFGDEGIDNTHHYEKLLKLGLKYLLCGKEDKVSSDTKKDMDFIQDYDYIWASMYSDYNGLDIDKEHIHWWKFMNLMNGLSNSELGNCCVLNRIRNLRNFNANEIKDAKERDKIRKAQQEVALNKETKKVEMTEKQKQSSEEFYKNFTF